MLNSFLIHYGEISLKGKNQPQFRKQLRKNIILTLNNIGIDWPVKQFRGYLLLTIEDQEKINLVQNKLNNILGINWYSPALKIDYDGFGTDAVNKVRKQIEISL